MAWIRFEMAGGMLVGNVEVPKSAPAWFVPVLAELNSRSKRELSMTDFSVEEWLSELCSHRRPILVSKPLVGRTRQAQLYIRQGNLKKLHEKIQEGGQLTDEMVKEADVRTEEYYNQLVRSAEQGRQLTPGEKEFVEQAVPIPAAQLGIDAPQVVEWMPAVNPSVTAGVVLHIVLSQGNFSLVGDQTRFETISDNVYAPLMERARNMALKL